LEFVCEFPFFAFGEDYAETQRLDAVGGKILDRAEKLLLNVAARCSLQRRSRYCRFESKFDGDTNFETPVAIFVLQIE
jgi:hypothetical protein